MGCARPLAFMRLPKAARSAPRAPEIESASMRTSALFGFAVAGLVMFTGATACSSELACTDIGWMNEIAVAESEIASGTLPSICIEANCGSNSQWYLGDLTAGQWVFTSNMATPSAGVLKATNEDGTVAALLPFTIHWDGLPKPNECPGPADGTLVLTR